uniref:Aldo_ket_red domain-containing protein n=1 Tax=Bursaphelenchus xylophilus TaxID=6326 RepID=A0A1I7SHW2_BURXY
MTTNEKFFTKFSNGVKFPLIGYGTWLSDNPETLEKCLRVALDAGYRYIDTAYLYKNEHVIGEVLEEYYKAGKFKREDIFLTTKLPLQGHVPEDAEYFIQYSLKALKTDYIDLYLIHNACCAKMDPNTKEPIEAEPEILEPNNVPHIDTWRVLEKYYKQGTFRAIGVSNFTVPQLEDLYNKAEVKPQNLQVELHIFSRRRALVEFCEKHNITVTSYATLGSPARKTGFIKNFDDKWPEADCLNHPLVQELSQKYKKTPAQVRTCIRLSNK